MQLYPCDPKVALERDYKLDITWLKDESLEDADDLPEPDYLASEAITELEAVVDDLRDILELIEQRYLKAKAYTEDGIDFKTTI